MAVRGLVEAVEHAGIRREPFLAEIGINTAQLDDLHARLPIAAYGCAVQAAIKRSGDPALGLHMGERAGIGTFDVLGLLSEHCSTLREALEVSRRYARIVTEDGQLELHEHASDATLCLAFNGTERPEVRLTAEFSTIGLLRLVRRYVGADAQPSCVSFAYPAPAHHAEYRRIFGGRERFSQKLTGLHVQRCWLDQPQPGHSTELQTFLESRAELLLAKVNQVAACAEQVKRWLAERDPLTRPSRPSMEEVARGLRVSVRSLRRRLQSESVRFGDLVEGDLARRAKVMLDDPRFTVQEAAYTMGFATPSGFSRAFKQWTGKAPGAFRRSLTRLE
jgi:AraC-like DNA-binding protein